ncbi:MAG TPA: hypothetical protein VLM37_11700, partial [Fibrobacteraceae bacterium]|nr:hypothetical protein [Fibrobacteraceae bacterium]
PNLFESQPLVETLDQGLAILEDKGELDMTQFTEMLDEGIRNLVLLLREENWSPEAAQTEFLQTFAQIAIFRIQRARQSMQMQHPGTDAGLTQQTSLRLEANRLIRQLEIVRAKAGVEGQLSSASLLWNGLLEQIPQFLQKAMEKLD